jgi:hypothetical protein
MRRAASIRGRPYGEVIGSQAPGDVLGALAMTSLWLPVVGVHETALARDGLPLPGRTVPDVVSQLCYRVLGPYDHRARSVLYWAGLGGVPARSQAETAARFGVTGRTIGQRIQRVSSAGARLPLDAELEHEVTRPSRTDEDHQARTRWARLLGLSLGAKGAETRFKATANAIEG